MVRSLREALANKLSREELQKIRAFDIVGDMAIMKIPDELADKKKIVAEAIMKVHKNVKVVLNQISPVSGEFRTRELEWVAGEMRTETFHHENCCIFKVDLARVYFSPRLSTERMRIVKMVQEGETVVNMFAGVGCYSIQIAKYSNPNMVYSIDINPSAYELMLENIRLNKVGHKVMPILGDCRNVIKNFLANSCDRVLMPLPEFGREFFPTALLAIRDKGTIHFYDYGQEPDVFEPSERYLIETAERLGFQAEIIGRRKIRSYAPRCYHIVLDVSVRRI